MPIMPVGEPFASVQDTLKAPPVGEEAAHTMHYISMYNVHVVLAAITLYTCRYYIYIVLDCFQIS